MVDWPGAVYALQNQLGLDVHPGALTAFELRGYAHYLALGGREVLLHGKAGTRLPSWFRSHHWSQTVTLVTSRLFPHDEDATSRVEFDGVEFAVATLERGAFEMMYLVPKRQSYEEALQVMESLTALRPRVVQRFLETCNSVKAKRLFLHAAEQTRLPWMGSMDLSRVELGSGKRTIHPGGHLDKKYNLVVADTNDG